MKTSKLLTTSVAALTVVGAGLVYAQTTQQTSPATPAPMEQPVQAQPMTPPADTQTSPSQETVQRSPMTPDAQADRN
ncbi:hypothetical protein [Hydrogenophaga sp.]|uniref:hypothetical protein n=1 Tax=Hydrogenophaga sp. TaxID=1904254 RepID=UPI003D11271C